MTQLYPSLLLLLIPHHAEAYADYNDLNCTQYPTGSATFTNLELTGGALNWTAVNLDEVCGCGVEIGSGGEVTIKF